MCSAERREYLRELGKHEHLDAMPAEFVCEYGLL